MQNSDGAVVGGAKRRLHPKDFRANTGLVEPGLLALPPDMENFYAIVGTIIVGLIGAAIFVLSQEGDIKKKTKKDGLKPRGAFCAARDPFFFLSPRRNPLTACLTKLLRSRFVSQRTCTRSDAAMVAGGASVGRWSDSLQFMSFSSRCRRSRVTVAQIWHGVLPL